jgi:hypothetical protein
MAMPVVDRDLGARPLERIQVKVINRNDFPITDRFDGVVYRFEPADSSQPLAKGPSAKERTTTIPAEAANHIFGWTPTATREEMFSHFQRRCGWNTPAYTENSKGERFFAKIEITSVTYRLVEVPSQELVDEDEAEAETTQEAHLPRAPVRRGA